MKQGYDISAWQSEVSTATFKKNRGKLPCVILRSSYTTQASFKLYKDKVFDTNIKNAHAADMAIGIYHYSQAISQAEAVQEAEFVLKTIAPYKSWVTLPVFFDWEFGGRLSSAKAKALGKKKCADICHAFCNTIKKAGYKTGVYANLHTLNNYIGDISDLNIWCAQYSSTCDYKGKLWGWQYTSSGKVDGISGRIDMNYIYADTPSPTPPTPSHYKGAYPTLPKRGYFKIGDSGSEVRKLQEFLLWAGYGIGKWGADGKYGSATANAVTRYEKAYKLHYIDGEWGAECQRKAKEITM